MTDIRYPLPPFTVETAKEKGQLAENAWNTKDGYMKKRYASINDLPINEENRKLK